MQAQNVIVPIIDLTPTAEGSNLPGYLQTARGFDQTKVQAQGSTVTVTTTAGFYQLDLFINGEGTERNKKKAAEKFLSTSKMTMKNLKISALVKDALYYRFITRKQMAG